MNESVVINGVAYAPVSTGDEKLVIVMNDDRGLCLVGWANVDPSKPILRIRKARCIIRWGTDEHLAQLAAEGPLVNTILGYEWDHLIPFAHIALIIECSEDRWMS